MKALIIYQSRAGAAKQYSSWIHEEIDSEVMWYDQLRRADLLSYDLIVFVSPVFMGRIILLDYIEMRWDLLKDKNVVLAAVGIENPESEGSKETYNLIPAKIRKNLKYFKLMGKLQTTNLTSKEQQYVTTFHKDKIGTDNVSEKHLVPVISYLKKFQKEEIL